MRVYSIYIYIVLLLMLLNLFVRKDVKIFFLLSIVKIKIVLLCTY